MSNIYQYECAKGHYQSSPKALTECQGYAYGKRCTGHLVRTGPGSRTARKAQHSATGGI